MSNDGYLLNIEMFGPDNDLKAAPPLELPSLDTAIEQLDFQRKRSTASHETVRKIRHDDFLATVLGDVPKQEVRTYEPTDELVKTIVGPVLPVVTTIPASKPNSVADSPQRQKLKDMLQPLLILYSGTQSARVQETIQSLLDHMTVYIDGQVKAAKAAKMAKLNQRTVRIQ